MSKSSTVEIVIPILNEEATLDQQIRKLMAEIRHEKYNSYQILITIADNGSSDKSQEISQNLCNEFTGIKYLHITEKGVGRGIETSLGGFQCRFGRFHGSGFIYTCQTPD